MARDRQRAKQRRAARREARLAARRAGREPASGDGELDAKTGPLSGISGAPPENIGRSDAVAETPPPGPAVADDGDLDDVDPELEADAIEAGALAGEGVVLEVELAPARPGRCPRGVRGEAAADPCTP